jgi:hypothetical protein
MATQEEAYEAAAAWAKEYEKRDPYGNMAHAHGVVADARGGWCGVVNFYRSNT